MFWTRLFNLKQRKSLERQEMVGQQAYEEEQIIFTEAELSLKPNLQCSGNTNDLVIICNLDTEEEGHNVGAGARACNCFMKVL